MIELLMACVQVAGCICDEAYGGLHCENDFDGCADDPCYTDVSCTDITAPGAGFTCGPCPVGLTGNGTKCYGNDFLL